MNFQILKTPRTPYINFIENSGVLELKGRSIPDNPYEFYKPLIEFLTEYEKLIYKTLTINFKLEYFNTGTSKVFMDIFKILEKIHLKTNSVVVNWFEEKDDKEILLGDNNYNDNFKPLFTFNIIEIEEFDYD